MLQIKNLYKTYKMADYTVEALKKINISFDEKGFVSILGPSGCGKTTFLNIVGGLDKYTSGDVLINGVSTKHFSNRDWDTYRNHHIGFIFQSYNLIPHQNVFSNVMMALTIGGKNEKNKNELVLNALSQVGLKGQEKKKINQLSGGQMQRVAIARALVNNPNIILADEPTGALDSVTSVQIMELLKEISKTKLVIMVTHNTELAKKYSTRIVKLFDGEIVEDTKPFEIQSKQKTISKSPFTKKSKMGLLTSAKLSFKNLLSKKGRTFTTSFAGSIGIIGVALVLAINSGFNGYMMQVQKNALSGQPISVSTVAVNYSMFNSNQRNNSEEDENSETITPYNSAEMFIKYGSYNYLGEDFVNYVKDFEQEDNLKDDSQKVLNALQINYFTPLKIISKNSTTNQYIYSQNTNNLSVVSGTSNNTFFEAIQNNELILEQYDIISGSYPTSESELNTNVALVVNKGNKIDLSTLQKIGVNLTIDGEGKYNQVDYSEIVGKQLKLVFNNQYYIPNSSTYNDITAFSKVDTTDQTTLNNLYNDTSSLTLTISCILREKEDADNPILNNGIMYMPSLGTYYRNNCKNSLIAQKQEDKYEANDYTFYDNFMLNISEIGSVLSPTGYQSVAEINNFLLASYGFQLSTDEAYEMGIQQIGVSTIPVNILFYISNFEAKSSITNLIDEYNKTSAGLLHSISYVDSSEMLTNTLGQMIDIVSYVLIAFASISLVVSSIMIGIISYVSVIERTKEIGILRALGARKIDVASMFIIETGFIGLMAGIIGVAITYLLSIPINIISNIATSGVLINIAQFSPISGLVLVGISVALTVISGLIPAVIASKKDPVVSLRTDG